MRWWWFGRPGGGVGVVGGMSSTFCRNCLLDIVDFRVVESAMAEVVEGGVKVGAGVGIVPSTYTGPLLSLSRKEWRFQRLGQLAAYGMTEWSGKRIKPTRMVCPSYSRSTCGGARGCERERNECHYISSGSETSHLGDTSAVVVVGVLRARADASPPRAHLQLRRSHLYFKLHA